MCGASACQVAAGSSPPRFQVWCESQRIFVPGAAVNSSCTAAAVNRRSCVSTITSLRQPRSRRQPRHQSSRSAIRATSPAIPGPPPSNTRSRTPPSASAQGRNAPRVFSHSSPVEPTSLSEVSSATTRTGSVSSRAASPAGVP